MKLPIPEGLAGMTQGLFYEYRHQTTCKIPAFYNLKNKDWKDTKSMYLLYMTYETEYDAAIGILGSWPHWQKLCTTSWFKKYRDKWEEERVIRDDALAKRTLIEQAKDGNVTAAKALMSGGDKPGRPARKKSPKKDTTREERQLINRFKVHQGGKGDE